MSQDSDADDALGLAGAFEPAQVQALERAMSVMRAEGVSRADFDRLEGMVAELLERLPPKPKVSVSAKEIVIMAAVITDYLGKRVRIHGARRLAASHVAPWAQHGRLSIQGSRQLHRKRKG